MENAIVRMQNIFFSPPLQSSICIHEFVFDYESNSIVCHGCGLVKETNPISNKYSWKKNFQELGFQPKLRNAKTIPNSNLKRALKLDKMLPWFKKRVIIAENEIKRITSQLELSQNIKSRSIYILKQSLNHPSFRTHYISLMASVCVFYSCKVLDFPISLHLIIDKNKYSHSLALKYYAKLIHELDLPYPVTSPFTLLPNICTDIGLNYDFIQTSNKVLEIYLDNHTSSGYQIKGILAGVIYITCLIKHIPRSQQEIAKAIGISDITLRARYREIQKIFNRQGVILT